MSKFETNNYLENKNKLKAKNEKYLSNFSRYGINPTSLQQKLHDLGQDLGTFGPKCDGVDGDLGEFTFNAIKNVQSKLDLPSTGVVDFNLITLLYPRVFKTYNKTKQGRTINETVNYVKEMLLGEKGKIINDTIDEEILLKENVTKRLIDHFRNFDAEKDIGLKLAYFLENKGFPEYVDGTTCGANVGEALIDFGIKGLPRWGRDGYKCSGFLDDNPNFVKKAISKPSDAEPGGVLVYDKGYGRTKARKNYGHVEIKTNNGYWFGGRERKRPGGSTLAGFKGVVYYPKA